MSRTLTPWTARPSRLVDFEVNFPKWMTEVFGPEMMGFGSHGKYLPEANLAETESAVEMTMELPGMKAEDVKVELKGDLLWITGEKKEEMEEEGKTFHRLERRSGAFRRGFSLPAPVKNDHVEAKFVDGVLRVTLPKAENATVKKIPVTA